MIWFVSQLRVSLTACIRRWKASGVVLLLSLLSASMLLGRDPAGGGYPIPPRQTFRQVRPGIIRRLPAVAEKTESVATNARGAGAPHRRVDWGTRPSSYTASDESVDVLPQQPYPLPEPQRRGQVPLRFPEPLVAPEPDSPIEAVAAQPWWNDAIRGPLRPNTTPVTITLEWLWLSTLQHSHYVHVVSDQPLINETAITKADARFDWLSFADSQWNDISEPVGNRLTTGGPSRFRDDNLTARAGVRKFNPLGGKVEIWQQIGHQNTNSVFFSPPNQGNSRLTINYTQPLLRNAGRTYNTALTVLAEIDTGTAFDRLSQELQDYLLEVTQVYWTLHLQRGNLLQKQRLLKRAEEILARLQARQGIDAMAHEVSRARTAVNNTQLEVIDALKSVMNAEDKLRSLVNDMALGDASTHELIPITTPPQTNRELDREWSISMALQNRPEVGQAIKAIKAAGVRLVVAKNEALPALNVVLETYASGLRGESDIGGAIVDQFSIGEPSYTVALVYERPIWNRAPKAEVDRRRIELRQLENQWKQTVETLKNEVSVAVREVETTYQELQTTWGAMRSAQQTVDAIYDQWQLRSGTDRSSSLYLQDLLDEQERLSFAEFAYLDAQRRFSISHVAYLRALGTLLQSESIDPRRICECNLPGLEFSSDLGLPTPGELLLPQDTEPVDLEHDLGSLPSLFPRR